MQTRTAIALSALLLLSGTVATATPASASHPAAFPHKHAEPAPRRVVPRRVAPRRVAPRNTAPRHTSHRLYADTYGGLNVGASFLAGGTVSTLSSIAPSGVMLEAMSGWRMNPWVALEVSGLLGFHADEDPTTQDVAVLAAGCLNAKMYLNPSWHRFEPYVLLGVGIYGAGREDDNSGALGIGVQGGVGLDLRLNPAVSVSADATYRGALWEDENLSNFFQSFVTIAAGLKLQL